MNAIDVGLPEAGSSDPADLLRAELLAVEPSPRFAAGVRARIEAQGRQAFRWQPAFAFAAIAVAAVAVGAYLLQRGSTVAPAAVVPVAQTVTAPLPIEPSAPAAPKAAPRQLPASTLAIQPVVTAKAEPGPFLEVITDQPEVLRRVWEGIQGGVARTGLPANEFAEIAVTPIVVDAIVVPKIGLPGGGGLTPGARRVTSDDSMRGDHR